MAAGIVEFEAGTYCTNGTKNFCPFNSTSSVGSAAITECNCNPGYTRTANNTCAPPPGFYRVSQYIAPSIGAVDPPLLGTILPCEANEWCDGKDGIRHPCPTHSKSSTGSTSITECACDPSYFRTPTDTCIVPAGFYHVPTLSRGTATATCGSYAGYSTTGCGCATPGDAVTSDFTDGSEPTSLYLPDARCSLIISGKDLCFL